MFVMLENVNLRKKLIKQVELEAKRVERTAAFIVFWNGLKEQRCLLGLQWMEPCCTLFLLHQIYCRVGSRISLSLPIRLLFTLQFTGFSCVAVFYAGMLAHYLCLRPLLPH